MNQAEVGLLLLSAITIFFFLFILVMGVVLHHQEKKRDARLYKHWQEVSKRKVLDNFKNNPDKVRKILCKRKKEIK